jgi:hypothetical protein
MPAVLAALFFKQLSEVFVLSAGRLKIKDLVLNAHSKVIQRLLQAVDTFFELPAVCLCFLGKLGQLLVLRIGGLSKFFHQFVQLIFQVSRVQFNSVNHPNQRNPL